MDMDGLHMKRAFQKAQEHQKGTLDEKDKHDLVEDADLKFLDENESKNTKDGESSATKTQDLVNKDLIELTKQTVLSLEGL
jgi:hypothetical protein